MRRMTFFWALGILALSGCFDDAVTLGLGCENDLECGQGQACGPDAVEDDGSATPDQVCGVPQDEGWDACESTDRPTCGDFETVITCRNGFLTETDCDASCEAQVGGLLNDGVCGADDPDLGDCACAYLADDDDPAGAENCVQLDIGDETLEVVRSTFESDDVAVYLQTCDEWCGAGSEIGAYAGSVCRTTFIDAVRNTGDNAATAVANQIDDDQPCVCRLEQPPDCMGDPPLTRCLDTDPGSGILAFCDDVNRAVIECLGGCGAIEVGPIEFDWCL